MNRCTLKGPITGSAGAIDGCRERQALTRSGRLAVIQSRSEVRLIDSTSTEATVDAYVTMWAKSAFRQAPLGRGVDTHGLR
jgi:hypothetical protein